MKNFLFAAAFSICFLFPAVVADGQPGRVSVTLLSVTAQNYQKDSLALPVYATNSVVLPFDKNTLLFKFTAALPTARQPFYYMLQGLDYYWISCENCTQVHYAHLDGGEYTFLVKTADRNAVPAEFRFEIKGNILHRWWFVPAIALYILGIVGIGIYLLVLYSFRQKLVKQRLVHTVRMESMTELMSGIAHEILNPLNFITNFSEVCSELMDELKEEMSTEVHDQIGDIVENVVENLARINKQGHQANRIVQSMLEHSRTAGGEMQSVDLTKLITDCLNQALEAEKLRGDPGPITLHTDFDTPSTMVKVIPAEFGQVVYNLASNAFYAMMEKRAHFATDYQPTLWVSAHRKNQLIELRIKDNGVGIALEIKEKIFQPFFTTKPVGQGTGLGLSLCYDIITKGHSGTIRVESEEREGSLFIIEIPG